MLSLMWKKKTPKSTAATSTSKATPSSTTSGIPWVEETAARKRPFSMDMKPSTWATTWRRAMSIHMPSSTTATLTATMLRVSAACMRSMGRATQ